ncbi:Sec-independent protein translocase subunit TatB [Corynebacterium epidermidicanis]|uniref:Sec-independent protein translocase protein TatB n=1 Tax=Corynebacterium epidermidicanis TaxID=1050174 RepID=A0A0G3GTF9_9CORY|nr:Sec-independent protein translocase subunit TatB [Corynebacterium epidermidicanis]AKK02828.1 Sec-independent protein secretion pathway component [Corynebacterium epidermidicanis]
MFTNVGWGEILVLFIIGLIFIGPERLPKVIQDVRAALLAARTAIDNAKKGLNDEFGGEFDEFRKPLSDLATLQRMGPRAAITKALLDGDDSFLDNFDPKKIMAEEDTAGQTERARAALHKTDPTMELTPETQQVPRPDTDDQNKPPAGGFSWADIT